MMEIGEHGGKLSGVLQYNTDLFNATTIERMAGHFATLLGGIAADPDRRVSQLPLLTGEELAEARAAMEKSGGPHSSPLWELAEDARRLSPEAMAH